MAEGNGSFQTKEARLDVMNSLSEKWVWNSGQSRINSRPMMICWICVVPS